MKLRAWPVRRRGIASGSTVSKPGTPLRHRFGEVRRDERGSDLVELALVLPPFFLLLFGLFNFAIALFGFGNATFAARAAARYAALHSSTSLVPATVASVQSFALQFLVAAPSSGLTINATYGAGNTIGGTVNVSVTIVYPTGIPYSSLSQITVGSSAQRTITH